MEENNEESDSENENEEPLEGNLDNSPSIIRRTSLNNNN